MTLLFIVTLFGSIFSLYGLMVPIPITKPDGTLDVSSLMSHIALLEQILDSKASSSDLARLESTMAPMSELNQVKSDLATTVSELKATQTKLKNTETNLNNAIEELKELDQIKTDLNILQSQMKELNSCNTTGTFKQELGAQHIENMQNKTDIFILQSDVSSMKTDIFQLQSIHNRSGHATFTRWGRTTCPDSSKMIYKGYTGGTWYNDKGGSSNILCLPDHPIYANYTAGHQTYTSHIYGTEYQANPGLPLHHLLDEDMPCVVCESNIRSSVIMIPARETCESNWSLEYWGYLMGGYQTFASAEYICVDADAEARPGGSANREGQKLYLVESRCGALPCPPYQDNWELSCAVCTK